MDFLIENKYIGHILSHVVIFAIVIVFDIVTSSLFNVIRLAVFRSENNEKESLNILSGTTYYEALLYISFGSILIGIILSSMNQYGVVSVPTAFYPDGVNYPLFYYIFAISITWGSLYIVYSKQYRKIKTKLQHHILKIGAKQ